MPHGLDRYQGGSVRPFQSRQVSHQLGRLQAGTELELARLESRAEIEATRASAVAYVGKRAMQEVTMVSQLEQQLGALCPMAVSRLQAIGDLTAMAMAEVVVDAARRLR